MNDFVIRLEPLNHLPWLVHGFGTRLSRQWPPHDSRVANIRQIHSDTVVLATDEDQAGEGDALIANTPGLAVAIRTADCYPVLLADPVHRAVAAVHAGWRGTARQIVTGALAKMAQCFGTSPLDVLAAIGPGIGPCCYEVGLDVAQLFPEVSWRPGTAGKARLDLREANKRQLLNAGICPDKIFIVGRCTFCERELFESYRREGESAGRMVSLIAVL